MTQTITLESIKLSLEGSFGSIEDPRRLTQTEHRLIDIITIAILAVLCGADGWVGVETYGKSKYEWLKTFLELPNGIPSHDTFGRIFARLDPKEMEKHFQEWVKLIANKLDLGVVAIDGKSLNGSYDREEGIGALQMVSAWSVRHGLVLGQCAVDKKSNEITAIPLLLEQLDLRGAIVTIDAMGTQKSIAEKIKAAGADYILTLKSNHPTLAQQAQGWFEEHRYQSHPAQVHVTSLDAIAGHDRLERRQFWLIPVELVFSPAQIQKWTGLRTLVVEESSRGLWNKTTHATRFFLSSLEPTFQSFPASIRSHWEIENSLHWCLDVVFAEDDSRVRKDHAPRNLSIIRRLALNLLRNHSAKGSLKMKRYRAGLDNNFLLSLLRESGIF
jgi:predicted transposase YbfD/YdcC